jgi:hypothetical protein
MASSMMSESLPEITKEELKIEEVRGCWPST